MDTCRFEYVKIPNQLRPGAAGNGLSQDSAEGPSGGHVSDGGGSMRKQPLTPPLPGPAEPGNSTPGGPPDGSYLSASHDPTADATTANCCENSVAAETAHTESEGGVDYVRLMRCLNRALSCPHTLGIRSICEERKSAPPPPSDSSRDRGRDDGPAVVSSTYSPGLGSDAAAANGPKKKREASIVPFPVPFCRNLAEEGAASCTIAVNGSV